MNDFAGLVLSPAQYTLLAEYCRGDPDFPTWEDWHAAVTLADASATAFSPPLASVVIDAAHFRRWCTRVGIIPCLDALRAYVIVQRAPRGSNLYGQTVLDSRPGELARSPQADLGASSS